MSSDRSLGPVYAVTTKLISRGVNGRWSVRLGTCDTDLDESQFTRVECAGAPPSPIHP